MSVVRDHQQGVATEIERVNDARDLIIGCPSRDRPSQPVWTAVVVARVVDAVEIYQQKIGEVIVEPPHRLLDDLIIGGSVFAAREVTFDPRLRGQHGAPPVVAADGRTQSGITGSGEDVILLPEQWVCSLGIHRLTAVK